MEASAELYIWGTTRKSQFSPKVGAGLFGVLFEDFSLIPALVNAWSCSLSLMSSDSKRCCRPRTAS